MMRAVLSCLMSLLLVVTSHSMATARYADPAVDQMVICAGNGTVLIHIDAEGEPTQAPHLCPDCALHVLAQNPVAHWVLLRAQPNDLDVSIPVSRLSACTAFARALARAPPLLT